MTSLFLIRPMGSKGESSSLRGNERSELLEAKALRQAPCVKDIAGGAASGVCIKVIASPHLMKIWYPKKSSEVVTSSGAWSHINVTAAFSAFFSLGVGDSAEADDKVFMGKD